MSLPPWDIYTTDPFADLRGADDAEPIACSQCGMAQIDLYQTGYMGCSECYKVFAGDARRALTMLHGTHRHVGKDL